MVAASACLWLLGRVRTLPLRTSSAASSRASRRGNLRPPGRLCVTPPLPLHLPARGKKGELRRGYDSSVLVTKLNIFMSDADSQNVFQHTKQSFSLVPRSYLSDPPGGSPPHTPPLALASTMTPRWVDAQSLTAAPHPPLPYSSPSPLAEAVASHSCPACVARNTPGTSSQRVAPAALPTLALTLPST